MQRKTLMPFVSFVFVFIFVSLACGTTQPTPTSTSTPQPTATNTVIPTETPRPSPTPRPTRTPDLAATQHAEELNAEMQAFYEKGYLATTNGSFMELDDFKEEWAQLDWYQRWTFDAYQVSDFYMSGHFTWTSAYRSANLSGCGFVFAEQEDGDHYVVFLDRSKILFADTSPYYTPIRPTRGTGLVNFDNPFDHPIEADFTLIVKDAYAYVLVDGEIVGEYTLSQSKVLRGKLGLSLLSGTNKDYGTRCEMTNLHIWIPKE